MTVFWVVRACSLVAELEHSVGTFTPSSELNHSMTTVFFCQKIIESVIRDCLGSIQYHHKKGTDLLLRTAFFVRAKVERCLENKVVCGGQKWPPFQLYFLSWIENIMDVAIFWDIAPCSQYVDWHFSGTYYLLQGEKSAKQETGMYQVPRLILVPWRWRWCILPKLRFTYGLHGTVY
jgi:hypothetical protein